MNTNLRGFEYLQFMTTEEAERLKRNISQPLFESKMNSFFSDFKTFVRACFLWVRTPEGFDYWANVAVRDVAKFISNKAQGRPLNSYKNSAQYFFEAYLYGNEYMRVSQLTSLNWMFESRFGTFFEALAAAFDWSETEEGEDYWYNIALRDSNFKLNS